MTAPTTVLAQAAQDLRNAAGELRHRGWTTGTYERAISGCVCLVGALRYAVAGTTFGPSMSQEERHRLTTAEAEVTSYLRSQGHDVVDPVEWNDTHARSGDEVAGLLEQVAAHLETLLPAGDGQAAADNAAAAAVHTELAGGA